MSRTNPYIHFYTLVKHAADDNEEQKEPENKRPLSDSRVADYTGALLPFGLGNALVGAIRGSRSEEPAEGGLRGGVGGLLGSLGGTVGGAALGGGVGALLGGGVGAAGGALSSMGYKPGPHALAGGAALGGTGAIVGTSLGAILGRIIGGAETSRYLTRDYLEENKQDNQEEPVKQANAFTSSLDLLSRMNPAQAGARAAGRLIGGGKQNNMYQPAGQRAEAFQDTLGTDGFRPRPDDQDNMKKLKAPPPADYKRPSFQDTLGTDGFSPQNSQSGGLSTFNPLQWGSGWLDKLFNR